MPHISLTVFHTKTLLPEDGAIFHQIIESIKGTNCLTCYITPKTFARRTVNTYEDGHMTFRRVVLVTGKAQYWQNTGLCYLKLRLCSCSFKCMF